MHNATILTDVVVLFGSALLVLLLSTRLRLPPVAGFLLTGALVGPNGLGLITGLSEVEAIAELGVVFLLFIVALELSLPRLRQVGRYMLVGGSLQFGLTAGAGWGIGMLVGLPAGPAAVAAMAVAMSSTAIALKVLADRDELQSPHGRASLGILLFQDLAFVPLLLLVPFLMPGGDGNTLGSAWLRIGGGVAVVAVAFLVGRTLVPLLLRQIVASGIRELFILAALVACLGGALLTGALGFSPALGAFLAGLLIADSEYHHHILTETGPFRDVFASLFFISVGMLLDAPFVAAHWPAVLGLAALAMVGKGVIVGVSVAMLGLRGRARVLGAAALAQVGEFAFVLLGAGTVVSGSEGPFALLIPAAVVTMMISPFVIRGVAERWGGLPAGRTAATAPSDEGEAARVLVAGYGLNGQSLVRVLTAAGISKVVVDIDGRRAGAAVAPGTRVVYGDVTRPDVLRRAGIQTVDVVVFALSDPAATLVAVRAARLLNPGVTLIARASRVSEIESLRVAGADEVVASEFETSIEIVTRLLRRLHVPGNVIRAQARLLRADSYQMLRTTDGEVGMTDRLAQALASGTTDTVLLAPGSPLVGETLSSVRLRERSGASVVSVIREGRATANPAANWTFQSGDILFLLGSHEQIESAVSLLEVADPEG